jgi:hypothetical protein
MGVDGINKGKILMVQLGNIGRGCFVFIKKTKGE